MKVLLLTLLGTILSCNYSIVQIETVTVSVNLNKE